MPDVSRAAAPTLRIVGVGVGGLARMTFEVAEVVRGAAGIAHLTALDAEEWASLTGAPVRSLAHHYREPDLKSAYRAMARDCVADARAAHAESRGYAVLAMYGHPLWFVTMVRHFTDRAGEEGIVVDVFPGLSSLDTMLLDSPADLGSGVCVFDGFQFLRDGLTPETRLPLLLNHFGELLAAERGPELADRLSGHYPIGHRMHAVRCERNARDTGRVLTGTIAELLAAGRGLTGSTLVVPATVAYRAPLS